MCTRRTTLPELGNAVRGFRRWPNWRASVVNGCDGGDRFPVRTLHLQRQILHEPDPTRQVPRSKRSELAVLGGTERWGCACIDYRAA
jgi:hypothetical protein